MRGSPLLEQAARMWQFGARTWRTSVLNSWGRLRRYNFALQGEGALAIHLFISILFISFVSGSAHCQVCPPSCDTTLRPVALSVPVSSRLGSIWSASRIVQSKLASCRMQSQVTRLVAEFEKP